MENSIRWREQLSNPELASTSWGLGSSKLGAQRGQRTWTVQGLLKATQQQLAKETQNTAAGTGVSEMGCWGVWAKPCAGWEQPWGVSLVREEDGLGAAPRAVDVVGEMSCSCIWKLFAFQSRVRDLDHSSAAGGVLLQQDILWVFVAALRALSRLAGLCCGPPGWVVTSKAVVMRFLF